MGVRVQDLLDPGILAKKIEVALTEKNQVLTKVYNRRGIDPAQVLEEYLGYAERLKPHIADTSLVLSKAAGRGQVRAAGGRSGHAARHRPRHVPVRHVVLSDVGRRVRGAPASRRTGSRRSSGS
ncbi:hypothetical protein GCM10020220_109150 [Nonomuraea rubra]